MIDLKYLPQLIIAYYGNDLIHINNADKDKKYTCPCCGNIVKPRAFNSEMKQPHYYHLNSECNKESQIHWLYKNYLFKPGSKFIIENIEYEVDSIEIEKSWNTTLGIYRPDITVYTKCNKKIFFELYFTNNKDEDYLYKWQELECSVVEVNLKDLINSECKIPEFKYIYHNNKLYIKSNYNYAKTIGLRKAELYRHDYLNYKMHWEKLDSFYLDLKKFISKEIPEDDLLNSFKNIEYDDMFCCYENIKRTNCVKFLKDKFRECINNKTIEIIKSGFKCPVTIDKISERTFSLSYNINFYGNNIKYINKHTYKITFKSNLFKISNDVSQLWDSWNDFGDKLLILDEAYNSLSEKYNLKIYGYNFIDLIKLKIEAMFFNVNIYHEVYNDFSFTLYGNINEHIENIKNNISELLINEKENLINKYYLMNIKQYCINNITNINNTKINSNSCSLNLTLYYDDVMLYYKKIYPEDNYIDIIQKYNKKSEEIINKYNELKDLSQKINKCKNELWCSNIRFNIFKSKIEFIIMLKKYPKFYRKIDFNLSLDNLEEQILKAFNSILHELESCGIRIIFEGEV